MLDPVDERTIGGRRQNGDSLHAFATAAVQAGMLDNMQHHLAAPRGLRSEFEDYGFDERRLPAKKKKSRRGRSDKQRFTALHTDDPGGAPYDDVEEAEARELRLRELYPEVVDPPFSEGRLDEMA